MPETPHTNEQPHRFRLIGKYFREYRWYLILGFASIVLANALILITPYITNSVIDLLEGKAVASPSITAFLAWFESDSTMSKVSCGSGKPASIHRSSCAGAGCPPTRHCMSDGNGI